MTSKFHVLTLTEEEDPDSRCPLLLFKNEISSCDLTLYNATRDHFYVKEIAEFKDKYICGSSHGWLVMIDTHDSTSFLFNPFTCEKIELPSCESMSGSCLLSSPPSTQSCLVIFLDTHKSSISFCRLGEMEWNQVRDTEDIGLASFTICKEKVYFLNYKRSLFVLEFFASDVRNSRLRNITEVGFHVRESGRWSGHLITSGEDIFATSISWARSGQYKIANVEVYKMDFSKLEWVMIDSLGDLSLFINIDGDSTMSRSASEIGVKTNSIYMVDGRLLYRYDMNEEFIYRSLPCPNIDREWIEIENNVPVWL